MKTKTVTTKYTKLTNKTVVMIFDNETSEFFFPGWRCAAYAASTILRREVKSVRQLVVETVGDKEYGSIIISTSQGDKQVTAIPSLDVTATLASIDKEVSKKVILYGEKKFYLDLLDIAEEDRWQYKPIDELEKEHSPANGDIELIGKMLADLQEQVTNIGWAKANRDEILIQLEGRIENIEFSRDQRLKDISGFLNQMDGRLVAITEQNRVQTEALESEVDILSGIADNQELLPNVSLFPGIMKIITKYIGRDFPVPMSTSEWLTMNSINGGMKDYIFRRDFCKIYRFLFLEQPPVLEPKNPKSCTMIADKGWYVAWFIFETFGYLTNDF